MLSMHSALNVDTMCHLWHFKRKQQGTSHLYTCLLQCEAFKIQLPFYCQFDLVCLLTFLIALHTYFHALSNIYIFH